MHFHNTYLQEIGRSGRRGQALTVILYYSKGDIVSILPGMSAYEQKYNK